MKHLLARYLADFNRHEWFDPRDEPGLWSTVTVVMAALALVVVFLSR